MNAVIVVNVNISECFDDASLPVNNSAVGKEMSVLLFEMNIAYEYLEFRCVAALKAIPVGFQDFNQSHSICARPGADL